MLGKPDQIGVCKRNLWGIDIHLEPYAKKTILPPPNLINPGNFEHPIISHSNS